MVEGSETDWAKTEVAGRAASRVAAISLRVKRDMGLPVGCRLHPTALWPAVLFGRVRGTVSDAPVKWCKEPVQVARDSARGHDDAVCVDHGCNTVVLHPDERAGMPARVRLPYDRPASALELKVAVGLHDGLPCEASGGVAGPDRNMPGVEEKFAVPLHDEFGFSVTGSNFPVCINPPVAREDATVFRRVHPGGRGQSLGHGGAGRIASLDFVSEKQIPVGRQLIAIGV